MTCFWSHFVAAIEILPKTPWFYVLIAAFFGNRKPLAETIPKSQRLTTYTTICVKYIHVLILHITKNEASKHLYKLDIADWGILCCYCESGMIGTIRHNNSLKVVSCLSMDILSYCSNILFTFLPLYQCLTVALFMFP